MARYLVVAHQTATSRALLERAAALAASDGAATFTLLVPATHATNLLDWDPEARFVWDEQATFQRARAQAGAARSAFLRAGLRVTTAVVGDHSPVLAVEDQLRARPGAYDAILLSTLPAGRSRWIAADVGSHLERFGLPVIHVAGGGGRAGYPGAVLRRLLAHIPLPGPVRAARGLLAVPEGGRGIAVIAALMALYVLGSATLAVTIDRRYFLNDAMAIAVFGVLLGWLVMEARRSAR